ncbi:hypothetical protein BDW60DRAFT_211385 [Aspergillus nidulans var. acristatus]
MSWYTSFFDEAMDGILYNGPLPHSLAPLEELPELYSPAFSGSKTPMLQGVIDLDLDAGSTSFSEISLGTRTIDPRVPTLKEECHSTQGCDIAVDSAIAPSNPSSPSDCPQLDNPNSPGPVEESSSCHAFSDDNAEDSDTDYLLILLSEQEFLEGELKALREENMNLMRLLKEALEDGRTRKEARGGKAEGQVKASRVRKPAKGGAPALPRRSGRKREMVNYWHWQWLPGDEVIVID